MSDAKSDRPSTAADPTTAELEAMEVELLAGILAFSAHSARPVALPEELQAPVVPVPENSVVAAPPAVAAPPSTPPPLPKAATPPAAPPPAPSDGAPGGSGIDLLSELRQAAAQAESEDEVDAKELAERKKRMAKAMRQIFDYLSEFTRHVDTLKPDVPHVFRLSPQIQIGGLAWSGSFVDFRRVSNSEFADLDSVSMRVTLASAQTLAVVAPPHLAVRQEDELAQVGLKYVATDRKNPRGGIEAVDFEVRQEISVVMEFKADVEQDQIVIRGRNFRGFGRVAYAVAVTEVNKAMLDELGRYLIGRPSRIFSHWQPLAL